MLQAKVLLLLFLGLLAVVQANHYGWDNDPISIQRHYLGTHKCPPNFYKHFIKQVNKFRSAKNAYALSNNNWLNDYAQLWSDYQAASGKAGLNPDLNSKYGIVGENMMQIERFSYQDYMDVDPKDPVEYWYWDGYSRSPITAEEDDRFKYYAQLVWPKATQVGVGCTLVRPQYAPQNLKLYIVAYFAKGPLINKPDPYNSETQLYPNRITFKDYHCPEAVKQDLLAQINYKRQLHLAPPLSYRFDLATWAQEWANQVAAANELSFRESTQLGWPRPLSLKERNIGENLQAFWAPAPIAGGVNYFDINVNAIVNPWYDKVNLYKSEWYDDPLGPPYDQRFAVQDFTNLVWVGAKEVGFGCRVIRAPSDPKGGTKFFIVVNIGPNSNRDVGADYYINVKRNPYQQSNSQPPVQDQFIPPPVDQYPPPPPPVDQFPDPDVYPVEPPVGNNKPKDGPSNPGNLLRGTPLLPPKKNDFCGCWV